MERNLKNVGMSWEWRYGEDVGKQPWGVFVFVFWWWAFFCIANQSEFQFLLNLFFFFSGEKWGRKQHIFGEIPVGLFSPGSTELLEELLGAP